MIDMQDPLILRLRQSRNCRRLRDFALFVSVCVAVIEIYRAWS
ncbi:hypothetical protein [Cupriavidus necator]